MLERAFEILFRLHPEDFVGEKWTLRAQQLSLTSGRLDLLFSDPAGTRHVVELKKGPAGPSAIDQVCAYASDLHHVGGKFEIVPWVVAHQISESLKHKAAEHNVRCLEVSLAQCDRVAKARGISEADLLGPRKDNRVLTGGSGKKGLRSRITNSQAYKTMPTEMARYLRGLERTSGFDLASSTMFTVIYYKFVKIGGVNVKHRRGVAYIPTGVVLNAATERRLAKRGFRYMEEVKSGGKHVHVWWEVPYDCVDSFSAAIDDAVSLVDRIIG